MQRWPPRSRRSASRRWSRAACDFADIDFADDAAHEAAVIADYRDAGVKLVSCGVNAIRGDAADAEGPFRFAQKAGLSVISGDVMPPASWDTFAAAERLAEQYDVSVALHNHGGQHWIGNAQMLEEVFRRTGASAHRADAGHGLGNRLPVDRRSHSRGLRWRWCGAHFGERLMGVHLKDFVSRVTAHQNLRLRPALADLRHYRLQFLHCPVAGVAVGAPQPAPASANRWTWSSASRPASWTCRR